MSNFIDIIIRAYDKASEVGSKVASIYQKNGEAIKKSFENARKADELFKKSVEDTAQSGQNSFNQLTAAQQKYYTQTSKTESYNKKLGESIKTVGTNGMSAYAQISSKQQSYLESTTKSEQITRKMSLIFDDVKNKASSAWETIKNKASSAMETANQKVEGFKGKINSLNDKLGTVGQGFTSVFGALGLGSITDATIGLAMAREQMTNLMGATLGSAGAAKEFVGYLDKMTNESLVSLNDLGTAMNSIKMATGMSNDELKLMAPTVNDIGQRAILMGKDSTQALDLMKAAGRGLNGDFQMLHDAFGVSKKALEDAGWSGAADDVEGYQKALQKVLDKGGSMDEMMKTTDGQIALVKKGFSTAGREIGEIFLPAIKQVLSFMVELKENHPGIFKLVIVIGALVSAFALVLPVLVPIISAFQKFGGFLKDIPDHLKTIKDNIQKIPEIPGKVRDSFDKIKNGAKSAKDKIVDIKKTISGSWQDGKLSSIRQKFDSIKSSASGAGEKIKKMGGNLKNIVSGKLDSVKTAITNVGTSAKEAATKLWGMATAHIAAGKQALINAGHQAKAGLASAASALKTGILTVATWLQTAAQTALNFVMALNPIFLVVMAVAALIAVLVYLYYNCEEVRNAINWLWEGIQQLAGIIWDSLIGAWNALMEILQPVADFLTGLWNSITGGGESVGGLSSVFTILMTVLTPLWEFLVNVFKPVWDSIVMVFMIVWTHVQRIIQIFTLLLGGQISLSEALSMIWQTILSLFSTVLTLIVGKVVQFATQLWHNAVKAGSNFVNGILNFIKSLPGRIWAFLLFAIAKVVAFATSIRGKARTAGTNLVNGFINQIKDLPGKVWQEMQKIGQKIVQAGSDFVNKAKEAAGKLKSSFLGALGIHSPGDMFRAVKGEIEYIGEALTNGKDYLESKAEAVAESIKAGFGSPELNIGLGAIPSDIPIPQDSISTNNSGQTRSEHPNIPDGTVEAINKAAVAIPDESLIKLNENSALTQLTVDKTTEGVLNSFTAMTQNVDEKLSDMVRKDKISWTKINNDTNSTLRKITSSTKSSVTQMNSAWSNMKNKINSAASNIKTQSRSHFNQLSSTISSFYGKLQNPSRWGAGPAKSAPSYTPRTTTGAGGSAINSLLNKTVALPQTQSIITLNQAKSNPCVNNNCLDYAQLNKGLIDINDIVNSDCLDCSLKVNGGAGWSETVGPNVKKIKDTSNKWNMKGPVIAGKYNTGLSFKVKDFLNGTPKIGFDSFKSIAESIFSQIRYDFYFDSEKYGNWLNAFNHGQMNCSDSTDALIALAQTCGLSASKVHGYWGSVGHFWANIAGQKMDTTGFMLGKGWTPSQSHAGPVPNDPFTTMNEQTSILDGIATDLKNERQFNIQNGEYVDPYSEIELKGKVTIVHEFVNLPDSVDAKELARLLDEKTTGDENWIKKLVNNNVFQNTDIKAKKRISKKNIRARGA